MNRDCVLDHSCQQKQKFDRKNFFLKDSSMTKHNILNPFQSGFRPGYSTTTALPDEADYLYDQRQHCNTTGAIFLDLKKAFDTVNTFYHWYPGNRIVLV